ncbi:TrmH family RNA methyltransferase, partial [Lysobacter sp. 2RAB21]
AMKTMGLSRLVLVAPEKPLDRDAYAMAAGADDVLEAAIVLPDLAAAVADSHWVLGCTARSRRIALEELVPRDAAARVDARARGGSEVALVFGRERTGLDNEELQLCHAAVHIPG